MIIYLCCLCFCVYQKKINYSVTMESLFLGKFFLFVILCSYLNKKVKFHQLDIGQKTVRKCLFFWITMNCSWYNFIADNICMLFVYWNLIYWILRDVNSLICTEVRLIKYPWNSFVSFPLLSFLWFFIRYVSDEKKFVGVEYRTQTRLIIGHLILFRLTIKRY